LSHPHRAAFALSGPPFPSFTAIIPQMADLVKNVLSSKSFRDRT
jgi:hypothetical protein